MTEAEWLACADAREMLEYLLAPERFQRTVAGKRKLRLFACACCRSILRAVTNPGCRQAVEVGERLAEGRASEQERDAAFRGARGPANGPADDACQYAAHRSAVKAARTASSAARAASIRFRHEQAHQSAMLRCVVGNPFRNSHCGITWKAFSVPSLAKGAYEDRALPSGHLDPARLAVLSDALEEAGCTAADLLGHLRSPGPHVRGCWALDLILGKQ
jgi:hypothetical protein